MNMEWLLLPLALLPYIAITAAWLLCVAFIAAPFILVITAGMALRDWLRRRRSA